MTLFSYIKKIMLKKKSIKINTLNGQSYSIDVSTEMKICDFLKSSQHEISTGLKNIDIHGIIQDGFFYDKTSEVTMKNLNESNIYILYKPTLTPQLTDTVANESMEDDDETSDESSEESENDMDDNHTSFNGINGISFNMCIRNHNPNYNIELTKKEQDEVKEIMSIMNSSDEELIKKTYIRCGKNMNDTLNTLFDSTH